VRVTIVCPVPAGSRLGNRITAVRWRAMLESLGHHVRVATESGGNGDVLIALHAYKTAEAVRAFRAAHPASPIVVALTGTDLYRDIHVHAEAKRSLELADRLVVLHDQAARALPPAMRRKVRLIRQSAEPVARKARRSATFDVALVAHLRAEKDPLRAAIAARALAPSSRVRIVHAGRALTDDFRAYAEREQAENARYLWLGEVAPARARRLIATSRVLVLTSHTEGGANVLGEAIMSGTPVIASRIPAAVSALGGAYRGFFPPGDTRALTRLLARAENDRSFLAELTRATRARRPLFAPSAERAAWRALLDEIT
jgi:putative glycosyltransferase (TIGR04348 family)